MRIRPDVIVTLLIAAVLIGTLSFVLPKNKEKYLRDRFWTQKTFAPAKYQVVVLGDSRVYRGVSPEVMEKNLPGMKILNFGYSNGGLNPVMFEAAEKKLSKNNQKRVIAIGVSANCITAYSQTNEQFQQERMRPREEIFERLYLNGILYMFSATTPEEILDLLKSKPLTSYYRNEYFSSGYVESEKFPVDTMESISSYTEDFTNYKVKLQYIESLARQVKDWSSRGICVVGFRPPASAPMRALEDSMGLYNETIISARFRESGGHWMELKTYLYKTYDGSHLDRRSAIMFSNDLAREIKGILNPEDNPVQ